MRVIDEFSKVVGIMTSFNEMVSCGCKRVALGHPVEDRNLRDEYMIYAREMCAEKGTFCCEENGGFITDLFPCSMNKDKYNILFYLTEKDKEDYFELKARKEQLVQQGKYEGEERRQIAYEYGKLLSYTDERIRKMMDENSEKE